MKAGVFVTFLSLLSLLFSVQGQNCLIQVPAAPLSAAGLETPYVLLLPCNQSLSTDSSFVEATVFDTSALTFFAYHPLVITQGTNPLVTPVMLQPLTISSVVGIWFGSNAGSLTLTDNNNGNNVAAGLCVNGVANSIFGQVAYCNAVEFFLAVNNALLANSIIVPPLGTANDGLPCPTSRDFFVVDMDQSDNVVTTYLSLGGSIAQYTATNYKNFPSAIILSNGSDERLVSIALDTALGCTPWNIPSMTDPTNTVGVPTFATNEIFASVRQPSPQALTPLGHAMTRVNNQPSLLKTNAYRQGCDQPLASSVNGANTIPYCTSMYYTAPARIQLNANNFVNFASPSPAAAINLFAFMAQRFAVSFDVNGLNCVNLLGVTNPIVPIMNTGGVAIGATITVPVQTTSSNQLSSGAVAAIVIVVLLVVSAAIAGVIIKLRWTQISTYWHEKDFRLTFFSRQYS